MDPVSGSKFGHDAQQYIYQTPNVQIVHHGPPPTKPFEVEAPDTTKKTKKDLEKRKQEKGKK